MQLAEDEEQLHQLLMIQEMIDDGEPIEEVRVSIETFNENNYYYMSNNYMYFIGSITISWVKK